MSEDLSLPEMLKAIRARAEVSKAAFALSISASERAVESWESGRGAPSTRFLGRIVTVYRLSERQTAALCRAAGDAAQAVER